MILLTGFGPFLDVPDNPSARLVRAVHGRAVHGHGIHTLVLDVDWQRALPQVVSAARATRPALILGFGVASRRTGVQVETRGVATRSGADIHGHTPTGPWPPPDTVDATADVARLAEALSATLSTDAGTYLCNGWLHQVVPQVQAPATFVHLPPAGMDPHRLLTGLARYLTSSPRQRDSAAATS